MNAQNFNPAYAGLQMKKMISAMFMYVAEVTQMPDEQVMRFPDMFDGWAPMTKFSSRQYIRWGFDAEDLPIVYQVLSDVYSQANIPPGGQYSGGVYRLVSHVDGVRIWSEPLSVTDAPAVGIIRHYQGKNYRNLRDKNMFSPAQVDWEEVV